MNFILLLYNINMFEEPPKEKKKMSEERKAVLREQLRKAREKKLANKNAREGKTVEVKEKPVVEEIKMNIIPEEVEYEDQPEPVAPRTKKLVKKRVKIVEPESDEEEMIDATDMVENLKKEIAELKKGKTSSADMDEIRSLKEELKDIRDAARDYKKKKSEKPVEKPIVEIAKHVQQAPRFSTYKKSIWSNLL